MPAHAFLPPLPAQVTTNSLVDICVRSGDLDRAYNLLKNPTLFPAASFTSPSPPPLAAFGDDSGGLVGGGDSAEGVTVDGEVDVDVDVGVGATDMMDSPWGDGGGSGEYETGDFQARVEGEEVAPTSATAAPTTITTTNDVESRRELEGGEGGGRGNGGMGMKGGEEDAEAEVEAEAEVGGVRLVRPSVEAFTSVLTGFAGVGDKDRALAVFQQVRGSIYRSVCLSVRLVCLVSHIMHWVDWF